MDIQAGIVKRNMCFFLVMTFGKIHSSSSTWQIWKICGSLDFLKAEGTWPDGWPLERVKSKSGIGRSWVDQHWHIANPDARCMPKNLTCPLKNHGWKLEDDSFPSQIVPFQGTFVEFWGGYHFGVSSVGDWKSQLSRSITVRRHLWSPLSNGVSDHLVILCYVLSTLWQLETQNDGLESS